MLAGVSSGSLAGCTLPGRVAGNRFVASIGHQRGRGDWQQQQVAEQLEVRFLLLLLLLLLLWLLLWLLLDLLTAGSGAAGERGAAAGDPDVSGGPPAAPAAANIATAVQLYPAGRPGWLLQEQLHW